MKILFVAMSESIHTVRWIRQFKDQGWELYLFPSYDNKGMHRDLVDVEFCIPFFSQFRLLERLGLARYARFLYSKYVNYKVKNDPKYYSRRLNKYIVSIQPDILHSLETQGAGYLVSEVYARSENQTLLPVWLHTMWGSDIYLFNRLASHKVKIRRLLKLCDYISPDCSRDRQLIEEQGFAHKLISIEHATSGFNIEELNSIRNSILQKTSDRKQIMLKGYQGWSGRALVAIRALARCKDLLTGYTIVVYSHKNSIDITIAMELFENETGVSVVFIPDDSPHSNILKNQGLSRISIGLGISDGIPNSVLEAMAMGAFPIQSFTSAADEWFEDGETGFLVPPEDPEIVEIAIRKSLLNDKLVNKASEINWATIARRADFNHLSKEAIECYLYICIKQK